MRRRASIAIVGCASLALQCAPVVPALVNADDIGTPAYQACADGDLFADVPVEALVSDEALWVRGAGGTLASVTLEGDSRIRYHLDGERVLDVHQSAGGDLWVLTIADEPGDMRVWQRTADGWSPMWEMGAPSDAMALVELGGGPAVLTPERLYVATEGLWTRELEPALPDVTQYQTVALGSSVWVSARGVGWLYHLDAKTGAVRSMSDIQATPCGGLLDPSCDVISDLDIDTQRPGCALVTTRGRVLRVCPDASIVQAPGVDRAVRADWAEQIKALAMLFPSGSKSRAHLMTLARAENPAELAQPNLDNLPTLADDPIEALAPIRAGYLALGSAGLYRVHEKQSQRIEVGNARERCGLEVTRMRDAVVVNGSQPLPLLVSLNAPASPPPAVLPPPPAPCEDTVVFYAHGDPHTEGTSVVLRCDDEVVSMVERAQPADRTHVVPQSSWRALWADLERAQWRSWESCDPRAARGAVRSSVNGRFMISTTTHTLQVDCPPSELSTRQRAVLERLRKIADDARQRR